jgi:hypothetical protein
MPLPPGLALNPLTGQISGVPTTPGTYSFTLRVRDSQGSLRDIPSSITVTAYTPPSLSGTLAGFANRTVAYSSGLTRTNGTAPFVWSIPSGTLPTGLTINTSTGVISGTPTDTNYTDRTITVRVVDANGSAAQSTHTIRYADVLALSGSLNAGVQGSAYSDGFDRGGGHSPFTFDITSGSLPAGLSLNSTTGVISGTPSGISSTSLTIRVTDASGAQASRSDTLVINSSYVPVDITGSITSNTQNVETLSSFSITPSYAGVSVTGGSGTITYSWARISGSTAISAGAPTSLATSFVGTVSPGASVSAVFRVTATDGTSSDTLDVTITVNNTYVTLALDASSLPRSTRTVAYGITVVRSGGKSPYTFAVISGTLPTGITLNASTGQLSGTPTDTSYTTRSLTFRVTDALGATADAIGSIIYRNFPAFTFAFPPAMRTRAYDTTQLAPSTFHTPGTFSLIGGTPPTGIAFTGGVSFSLSGTPTDTGYTDRTLTIRYIDAAGNLVDEDGTLAYKDNIAIAGTLPAATQGVSYSSSALSASGGYGSNVWSIASGSLPAGLSINSGTGAVTGTPTTSGTSSFTVRVTDAQGFTADSAQSITVAVGLTVTASPTSASGSVFDFGGPPTEFVLSTSVTASASGGTPPYTFNGWTRISGSTAISASTPSSASTTFGGTIDPGPESATFRAQFTDAASVVGTVDVPVDLTYTNGV